MRIVRVDIENFRCIKHFEWRPHPGQNVLIGPSNCGKSTIIDALRLLLSPEHARIGEEDFTHYDVHNLARVPGGSQTGAVRIGASLYLAEEEWESFPELEEPMNDALRAWDPPEGTESTAVFDQRGSMLRIALFYEWDLTDPDDRAVAFFPKSGPPTSADRRTLGARHREALGFWVAPYDDPLWQIASLSRRSHLSRAAVAGGWDPNAADGIPRFLKDLIDKTEELSRQRWDQLQELCNAINDRMRTVLPAANLEEGGMGVTAALTDAWVQRMLELGLHGYDAGSRIPLSRQGAGTRRAFMIAAHAVCQDRAKATRRRKQSGRKQDAEDHQPSAGCIAIDEPEVGLHPQAQRALLQVLSGAQDACQLLVATHSPAVVEWSDPQSVWLLSNTQGTLKPMHLPQRRGSEKEEQVRKNADRFWPDIAHALFARAALIVEGSTEAGAIPVFDREWARDALPHYHGLDGHDIALVAAGSIVDIAPIARVLRHFGRRTIALHDFDTGKDRAGNRDSIEKAADFVLSMPDEDDARDFECMMVLDLTPKVLEAILTEWRDVYDVSETSFRRWALNGLQPGLRSVVEEATASDEEIPQCLGGLLDDPEHCEALRGWLLDRCKGRSDSDIQNIFAKSARYGRIWAQACVKHRAIPAGIKDLFTQLAAFVRAGYRPPNGCKVHDLRVGSP